MILLLLALQSATPVVPPPPMPITDCFAPGPFVLFFGSGTATLDAEATATLERLVAREHDPCGPFRVDLLGHAERGEPAGLDRRRAAAVRRYLIRRHLGRSIAVVRGAGTLQPRVPPRPGVTEVQNRRVEISALPNLD